MIGMDEDGDGDEDGDALDGSECFFLFGFRMSIVVWRRG
jgi:hypothetical protein